MSEVKTYVFEMLDENKDTKCSPKKGKKEKLAMKIFDNHTEEDGLGRFLFFNGIHP